MRDNTNITSINDWKWEYSDPSTWIMSLNDKEMMVQNFSYNNNFKYTIDSTIGDPKEDCPYKIIVKLYRGN